jgi:hypothetical protein
MAVSFGYEERHYGIPMKIGGRVLLPRGAYRKMAAGKR